MQIDCLNVESGGSKQGPHGSHGSLLANVSALNQELIVFLNVKIAFLKNFFLNKTLLIYWVKLYPSIHPSFFYHCLSCAHHHRGATAYSSCFGVKVRYTPGQVANSSQGHQRETIQFHIDSHQLPRCRFLWIMGARQSFWRSILNIYTA